MLVITLMLFPVKHAHATTISHGQEDHHLGFAACMLLVVGLALKRPGPLTKHKSTQASGLLPFFHSSI